MATKPTFRFLFDYPSQERPATKAERLLVGVEHHALKHVTVVVKHPHHYATAMGMTIFMICIDHYKSAELCMLWVYAMLENIFGDEKPHNS